MEFFLGVSFKILVLLNPFAVLSTFLALTSGFSPEERTGVACRCAAATLTAGVVLFFCGPLLFAALGINLDLFKAGGGVILMICAISLVWGKERKSSERRPQSSAEIAVVPLAIPMAVGPGAAAGLIVIGLERHSVWQIAGNLSALLLAVALLGVLLAAGTRAERLFKKSGITVITKLTGLFLSAIAAKMILEGVRNSL